MLHNPRKWLVLDNSWKILALLSQECFKSWVRSWKLSLDLQYFWWNTKHELTQDSPTLDAPPPRSTTPSCRWYMYMHIHKIITKEKNARRVVPFCFSCVKQQRETQIGYFKGTGWEAKHGDDDGTEITFGIVGEGAFSYCLQTTKDTIIEKTMSDLTANL